MEEELDLLTPQEVAGVCRVTVETVYRWIVSGHLPAVKMRNGSRHRYRVRRKDVTGKMEVVQGQRLDNPREGVIDRATRETLARFGLPVG